jgi:hypothetical protein
MSAPSDSDSVLRLSRNELIVLHYLTNDLWGEPLKDIEQDRGISYESADSALRSLIDKICKAL